MGCDIHITLGRVNAKAIEQRSGSTDLALFGNRPVEYSDFTLGLPPADVDISRNYSLFSFLANVRGSVKPLLNEEQLNVLKSRTSEFIAWLDQKMIAQYRQEKAEGKPPTLTAYGYEPDMESCYHIGDHNRVVHLISILRAFDYDQIVEEEEYIGEEYVYVKAINGDTYRSIFPKDYFELLEYCHKHGWNFLLLGFDS